jgi:hypothetical protein
LSGDSTVAITMSKYQHFDPAPLDAAGLNLQAIFNIADLPPEITGKLAAEAPYRQLLLLGHGGKTLWQAVKAAGIASVNPIDDFTVMTVRRCFAEHWPEQRYQLIYPGSQAIGLQALGKLAGWHHTSPFMVGINQTWGSWYAYRAVVLADSDFAPRVAQPGTSPCSACHSRACVSACPAGALDGEAFSLKKCVAWRKRPDSPCRSTCLARVSCPVAGEHRYLDEQIRHSYSISQRMIEQYY